VPLLRLTFLAVLVVTIVVGSASAAPTARIVNGTVGPGYTIKLTMNGKRVKSLPAGRYTFRVVDRSPIHNFVLERSHGGRFEKTITSVGFTGTKSVTVTLTKGEWEFYCAPHESTMHGDLTVT
jgi:plastocyanin